MNIKAIGEVWQEAFFLEGLEPYIFFSFHFYLYSMF